MSESSVLQQGAGYGVVLGIGFGFSLLMVAITWVQQRYTSHRVTDSEEFTSASRSVKPGLIASGIVSAWTWAATLLQSSSVAMKYGISGPWWYAAGATVQVLLFACIASKTKANAPLAHTYLEIIRARWDKVAHIVIMFFALSTNTIVSSMLILGGSATVNDLTGMPTLAACFLIPVSVGAYTVVGGMRSTLLADYIHTAVLVAIIFTFAFTVYATSDKIGSPHAMHALLELASSKTPVEGNAQGSYLTMRSKNGLIFGVINIIGNFATIFNDQAYHQRGVASDPSTAVKAFLMGGLAWLAVPWVFATAMGLAAVALTAAGDPAMPILTAEDISAGLAAPSAASALLGKAGATALLVLLFLAVTSAASAQIIAVSSVLTYDVYKCYFNPTASPNQIYYASHAFVVFWSVVMGFLGLIFYYIGISMGWLYLFMGVVLGSSVVPIACAIMWSKANRTGALVGAIAGFALGLMSWLVATATLNDGVISVATTGADYPMLTGNLVSIATGGLVTVIWSLISPESYDFEGTRAINASPETLRSAFTISAQTPSSPLSEKGNDLSEKGDDSTPISRLDHPKPSSAIEETRVDLEARPASRIDYVRAAGLDPVALQRAFRIAAWASLILLLVLVIIIPFPLFFSQVVYSTSGLAAWVSIGIGWLFLSAFTVVIYPVWESRQGLGEILAGLANDIRGRRPRGPKA